MLRGEAGVTIADDIEACELVRDQVGSDYRVMLDSAWAYSYPEALAVGRAIEDLDYYWYEDPLQADDIHGYRRLKQQLSIPIMATEMTEGGLYALAPWLTLEATDFLRGDVVIKGGITGMMKIAHLAESFHMNCELHDAYNALNNVATLHVAMALNNCEYYEVIAIHPPGRYDLAHLSYGLTEPIRIDASGNALAPTRPGLGYEIDWDLLDRTRLAEVN
jgi:L-alanine-DL-glutamate epimerase-like enolase superfamily enzyme